MIRLVGKYGRKFLTGLLLAMLFLAAPVYGQSKEKENRTVTIGYIDYKNFIQMDDDGGFSGYGVEYLQELAKYTGWHYEYVYDSWENHLQHLREGSLDFVCQAQKTPEREHDYIFSQYSIGAESNILYVRPEDNRYYYNDYEAFDGMRVGMLAGSYQNDEFRTYAQGKGFSFEGVELPSIKTAFEKLAAGEVDAVATGSLGMRGDFRAVCRYGAAPFYFMTGKGDSALMCSLNEALAQIKAEKPAVETELYTKYFAGDNTRALISFTRKEAEYIEQKKKHTVAFLPNRVPYSYINDRGEIDGVTRNIMDLIAQRSGLLLEYVMLEPGRAATSWLEEHPDALVAGVLEENRQFSKPEYLLSDVIYRDNLVLAYRGGLEYHLDAGEENYRLALPKSYVALQQIIEKQYPQFEIFLYNDTTACADAVLSGEADLMAQNVNVIRPLMQNPHYERLQIMPTFFRDENGAVVGLDSEENHILMGIINQCIGSTTEKEIEQFLLNQIMANGYTQDTVDIIYKYRYPLLVIALLLAVLFLAMLAVVRVRKRSVKKLEAVNGQLSAAILAADEANAAKSRFLAQMSHEIRTPMNAIIGFCNIAQRDADKPQKTREYLQKIKSSSRLLLGIINDILDMSALEAGKMKVDSKPFDFCRQVHTITDVFYHQAMQRDIAFEIHMKGLTEEKLVGDELRLSQIMMNLLSNAVKFTPAGGRVDVYVTQTEHHGNHIRLRIQVKDSGCGMSSKMLERVFKPFEQESASTARKYGGSGLGLSIAKSLTELMGGTIGVESEPGKGTCFTAELPMELAGSASDSSKEACLADIRVLTVDGDEEALAYCGELLECLGVSHQEAHGSEETLELMGEAEEEGKPFDICLIYGKMPVTDGVPLTERIWEIFGDDTAVIVASYDSGEIQENGKEGKAEYSVPKPLFLSVLKEALMQLANHGAGRTEFPARAETYDFSGKHVLVVEDLALNMEVITRLLGMAGIAVTCAVDGKQAVDIYTDGQECCFDMVLMDINMPVMDGYEAARRIRRAGRRDSKSIPIYAMTANAFAGDVKAALEAGMNGHIAKPIETETLYRELYTVFKGEKKDEPL